MLVEHADELLGDERERDRRRHRQEQRELQRAVLVVLGLLQIAGLQRARKLGQQHDADRHADDPERQLIEPVGILQDGDRAGLRRGDDLADEEVDLRDAAGDRDRRREPEQLLTPGVSRGRLRRCARRSSAPPPRP